MLAPISSPPKTHFSRVIYWHTALTILLAFLIGGCTSSPPDSLGLVDKQHLANCPKKPNCVASQIRDPSHFIEPLIYSGDQQLVRDKLIHIISSISGGTITMETLINNETTKDTSIYLRAQFQSKWFNFIDDAEFLIEKRKIQVRSAARIGYSDLGVNRKRMESIRQALTL